MSSGILTALAAVVSLRRCVAGPNPSGAVYGDRSGPRVQPVHPAFDAWRDYPLPGAEALPVLTAPFGASYPSLTAIYRRFRFGA